VLSQKQSARSSRTILELGEAGLSELGEIWRAVKEEEVFRTGVG
jgi:hypothetical protein